MSTSLTAANAPKGTLEDIRICAKALHDATPAKTHDHLCAAAHDITGGSQEAFELWASYCDATGQNDAHAHRVWDNMHANSIRATIGIHALTGLIREVTGNATWTVAKARRMARDADAVAEAATITVTVKLASGEVVEQVITWPRVNVTWRGSICDHRCCRERPLLRHRGAGLCSFLQRVHTHASDRNPEQGPGRTS